MLTVQISSIVTFPPNSGLVDSCCAAKFAAWRASSLTSVDGGETPPVMVLGDGVGAGADVNVVLGDGVGAGAVVPGVCLPLGVGVGAGASEVGSFLIGVGTGLGADVDISLSFPGLGLSLSSPSSSSP